MRIFITGIGGFIGRNVLEYLSSRGHEVLGSTHSVEFAPSISGKAEQVFVHDFDKQPAEDWFSGCDSVVHCAYDPSPGSLDRNVEGTVKLLSAAFGAGVTHQIFVSSHSARDDAKSEYGEQKRLIEYEFLKRDLLVIRPGMVIGAGGIFEDNVRKMLLHPVLLLPSPGRIPVFLLPIDDLLECIHELLLSGAKGEVNLYVDPPETLLSFMHTMFESTGSYRRIVPIPLCIFRIAYSVASSLLVGPRPSLQRIGVMLQNVDDPHHHESNLRELIGNHKAISSAVDKAIDRLNLLDYR